MYNVSSEMLNCYNYMYTVSGKTGAIDYNSLIS